MNIVVGNANVTKLIQNNTVARVIGEQLFPGLLYRGLAYREPWEAAVGQTMDFPMPGLFRVDTTPREPGVSKGKLVQDYERFRITMRSWGEETQVHMPSNYVTATSVYLEKLKALMDRSAAVGVRIKAVETEVTEIREERDSIQDGLEELYDELLP